MIEKLASLKLTWLRALLAIGIAAGLFAGIHPSGLAEIPAENQPVWGRKPVLYYFLLTPDLAENLRKDVGLSDAQFETLRQIADGEQIDLRSLNERSLPVIRNSELSLTEKRTQIEAMGYNAQVRSRVQETSALVEAALDEATYDRLLGWIEARWAVESLVHGSPQAADAGRTYNIFATYYESDDYTAALPDKCVKFSNNGFATCEDFGYVAGDNYSIRVKYGGNTVTLRVREAGPWNIDDTFWATTSDPTPRRLFTDLPLGMPEAQAAYFNGYNGGLDQYGRTVTAPFAIDLSYAVAPDLGLQPGQNVWLDVTFLWTDGWDSNPPPAEEIVLKKPSKLNPSYTGDTCSDYWYRINGYSGEDAYLTLNVNNEAYSTNSGEWVPNLPEAGSYRVEAYIPDHASITWPCPSTFIQSDTGDARYTIRHADGTDEVSLDQGPLADEWVSLGTYDFDDGTSGKVALTDLNGETGLTHTVSFSAMRFVLLSAQNPPTPTPTASPTPTATPTPTPTPTPQPYLSGGLALSDPGETLTVPLKSGNINPPGFGEVIVDVSYDPAIVDAVECNPNPDAVFYPFTCDLNHDHDGVDPDTVRISLYSTPGVAGTFRLAEIVFATVGDPGAYSVLDVRADTLADPAGAPLAVPEYNGAVCLAPCGKMVFMPLFAKSLTTAP